MKKLLYKEIKLAASPLSFIFVLFGLTAMIPGYPVLVGAFFITFGIFQSFQTGRENNDILYTALLPAAKSDVVRAKFAFCIFIETCGFALMAILTLVRMIFMSHVTVYLENALMNANFVMLGFALLIFGCFNFLFVRGFFKTAYKFSKPFIAYIVGGFLLIALAETLHHIPGLSALNAFGFDHIVLQTVLLGAGAAAYLLLTVAALKASVKSFERIDL